MSLDGDGFWIVLVNGIGSEILRRSLDTMKVGQIIELISLVLSYMYLNRIIQSFYGQLE